ncbi:HDOD domain-containing protein [Rhizobacter sp. SG703]|uniref:HDOD domain-containing protein n=1 Tax=Rhizobacter sp. SG703 TaxID=2587140 RepID=UPI001444E72A|nr:HDOD domain-containing protein [Rhizobacter sp. SG703]NKI96083.1 non-specific serine/threonine protein kinase [Rhizobacter sp. SG703]
MPVPETPAAKTAPTRAFGRYQLRQLLGKSDRSMVWLAFDPRASQEVMLTLPRVQPADAAGLEAWTRDAKLAARLDHPNLAHVIEVGVQDHWPYVAVDRALGSTLAERLAATPGLTANEAVGWMIQALEGLAFAHEAGVAHRDLQLHHVLLSEQGTVRVMALAVASTVAAAAGEPALADRAHDRAHDRAMPMDPNQLRAARVAAERDVLCAGLVLHQLLSGQPALDEPDTARVIDRLPPSGRDIIRLPWGTPKPIPDALRAIANRATDRQERQRYHSARTMLRAMSGWRETDAQDSGGAIALLIDRLRSIGHLPAAPGVAQRVGRLAMAEGQRTDEIAQQILQDMALSFELLRTVNSAQVQGTQISGNGPVLTIRRAVALVGLKGVRSAAAVLRPWPGPLAPVHADALQKLMDRVRLAGHAAQVLRPAGYDPEVVYLIATLQNLGRLMVQYHFPDEAEQIRQLMQPIPPAEPGEAEQPGMTEEGASLAVLGVDSELLGAAVARHWGLNDEVLHMARRLPVGRPVRTADSDGDVLRIAASAANEAVDVATQSPPTRVAAGLAVVAQRYARPLEVTARDIGEALQSARQAMSTGGVAASSRHVATDDATPTPAGGLRGLAAARSRPQ